MFAAIWVKENVFAGEQQHVATPQTVEAELSACVFAQPRDSPVSCVMLRPSKSPSTGAGRVSVCAQSVLTQLADLRHLFHNSFANWNLDLKTPRQLVDGKEQPIADLVALARSVVVSGSVAKLKASMELNTQNGMCDLALCASVTCFLQIRPRSCQLSASSCSIWSIALASPICASRSERRCSPCATTSSRRASRAGNCRRLSSCQLAWAKQASCSRCPSSSARPVAC